MFTEKIKIEGSFLDALSPDELVDLVQQLKAAGYGRSVAEQPDPTTKEIVGDSTAQIDGAEAQAETRH